MNNINMNLNNREKDFNIKIKSDKKIDNNLQVQNQSNYNSRYNNQPNQEDYQNKERGLNNNLNPSFGMHQNQNFVNNQNNYGNQPNQENIMQQYTNQDIQSQQTINNINLGDNQNLGTEKRFTQNPGILPKRNVSFNQNSNQRNIEQNFQKFGNLNEINQQQLGLQNQNQQTNNQQTVPKPQNVRLENLRRRKTLVNNNDNENISPNQLLKNKLSQSNNNGTQYPIPNIYPNKNYNNNGAQQIYENIEQNKLKKTKKEKIHPMVYVFSFLFNFLLIYELHKVYKIYKADILSIFNVIFYYGDIKVVTLFSFITFLLTMAFIVVGLKPDLLFKNVHNYVFVHSKYIVQYFQDIKKNGVFNFDDNRDEIVKILSLSVLNILIVSAFYLAIDYSFFQNKFNIVQTVIHEFFLLIGIVFFTNIMSDYILKNITNNLVEKRSDLFKIIYSIIFYFLGLFAVGYIMIKASEYFYNFLLTYEFLKKIFGNL